MDLREGARRRVRVARDVGLRPFGVGRLRHVEQREVEHLQSVRRVLVRLTCGGNATMCGLGLVAWWVLKETVLKNKKDKRAANRAGLDSLFCLGP